MAAFDQRAVPSWRPPARSFSQQPEPLLARRQILLGLRQKGVWAVGGDGAA